MNKDDAKKLYDFVRSNEPDPFDHAMACSGLSTEVATDTWRKTVERHKAILKIAGQAFNLAMDNATLRWMLAEEQQNRVDAESEVRALKIEMKMADLVIESLGRKVKDRE